MMLNLKDSFSKQEFIALHKELNIASLMPHPERALEDWMGSDDGLPFFTNIG